jgi:hypothetical protein
VQINPNPVPFNGQPVDGCSSPNTWVYEQVLRNSGGTRLRLTQRVNYFDGAERSRPNVDISIDPGQSTSVTTRWCSNTSAQHTARTDWMGADTAGRSINVTGPTVTLRAR